MAAGPLRIGVDLVQISQVANSIDRFGEAFTRRLFTDDEIRYCGTDPATAPGRFAARMAAKEATFKALGVADGGLDPRGVEVRRSASGACSLTLHGAARGHADAAHLGSWSVSLSHEGDYAIAMVVALAGKKQESVDSPP